jgi:hypothetical protein
MLVFLSLRVVPIAPGSMSFAICSPGSYVVLEINLPGYADVSDTEGANDNSIRVPLGSGANSPGHDFVDKRTAGTPAPTPVGQTAVPTSASPAGTPVPTPVGQTPEPTTNIGTSPPGIVFDESASPSESPSRDPTRCISGTVREDTNNDNSGDVVLPGVAITLFTDAGVFVASSSYR